MPQIMSPPYFSTNFCEDKWTEINWLKNLPADTFFALRLKNPSLTTLLLPLDHSLYVISFHSEPFDHQWVQAQAKRVQAPVIVLNDGSIYDTVFPSNCYFYNYYSWHYHIDTMRSWYPEQRPRNPQFKISTICNRITTAKLLAFTALVEFVGLENNLVKLSTWLNEKNVNYRQPLPFPELDALQNIFFDQWYGKELKIDDFNNQTDNVQSITGNPWNKIYTDTAVHLNLESYYHSYMINEIDNGICPGPSMGEKTFKCLIAGTPFIQVGQFDCYAQLCKLGLEFDYGAIDLSWDSNPGNFSRLSKIVDTIKSLGDMTIDDIVNMTKDSTMHNFSMIHSGAFSENCQNHNLKISQQVLDEWA
jgi:hypothetical protein